MHFQISILFLCLDLLFASGLVAQPAVVSGNAITYAGTELVFYSTAEYISGSQKEAGRCRIDAGGNFSVVLNTSETIQVFTFLGIYKGYLWIEPGRSYRIVLPEKAEKSPQEQMNPYFEPVEVHLGIENFSQEELNMLILMFNDAYNPYYEKHVYDIYNKTQPGRIDEDIESIEKSFRKYTSAYFRDYRFYSYGQLKLLANQQRVKSISLEYFNGKPVLYSNPAYMELFNRVYDHYFVFLARTEQGKKIYDDINRFNSYSRLLQTLSTDKNISGDTLQEMVIMKSVYDEYYGMEFSRSGLLALLDSLILTTRLPLHREIGTRLKHKMTRLQPGFEPPPFELYDADSNLVRLSDFRGKYIYLNFCTSSSYTCMNEFELLNGIFERHNKRLTIITVSTDPHEDAFRQFRNKNNYQWTFLYYGHQPEIIRDFDIRAFPTYFLIGPDGKLIFSPAPAPSENFEVRLFEVMQSRGDL
jgi:peroxiredoxin